MALAKETRFGSKFADDIGSGGKGQYSRHDHDQGRGHVEGRHTYDGLYGALLVRHRDKTSRKGKR